MMMTVQQTAPFSGLFSVVVSGCSFPIVAKSAAGICSPCNLSATQRAPSVLFYIVAQTHPFSRLWRLHRDSCQIMVVRAGQPSGWPVSNKAGTTNPVRATIHEICNSGGGDSRYLLEIAAMATTLTPLHS